MGYGDIRFHAKDNPSPSTPVVRTFKLGPKTAIGRYLSVTLYPRHSSLADTQSDISVQRIYVGRGDPALLSESVLMRKPEKKLRLVGSFRHVFVEETGEENRGDESRGQVLGADVPVAAVPVANDELENGSAQGQPGTDQAGENVSRYRASDESNNGTSLAAGELFRVSEFGDRCKRASEIPPTVDAPSYGSRFVAVNNLVKGNSGKATERVASPGPDQIEEWLAGALRFERPSLEEQMPAYVSEVATFVGQNTRDGPLSEEKTEEELAGEELLSQDESARLDEGGNDYVMTGVLAESAAAEEVTANK